MLYLQPATYAIHVDTSPSRIAPMQILVVTPPARCLDDTRDQASF